MKRLNIGLDVDDVLADFIGRYLELCREMYGKPAPGVMPTDWNMLSLGLTPEQLEGVWRRIREEHNFWTNLKRVEGVNVNALDPLADHKLYFITSRVPTIGNSVEYQTAQWLLFALAQEFPTVIVTDKKGPVAAALELDYFIDDRPKNCNEVKDHRPACNVFMKSTAHNAGQTYRGINRVRDVNEFVEEIKKAVRAESERPVGR